MRYTDVEERSRASRRFLALCGAVVDGGRVRKSDGDFGGGRMNERVSGGARARYGQRRLRQFTNGPNTPE